MHCTFYALIFYAALSLAGPLAKAEIAVSADFARGCIEVVKIDQQTRTLHLMPAVQPGRGWPAWWYARIDGLKPGELVTFSIRANPIAYAPSRILEAQWSQPAQAVFSTDQVQWTQTSIGQRKNKLSTYTFAAPAERVWIAWGPPFLPEHAEALLARVAAVVPGAERFTLAKTRGGHDVIGIKLGNGPLSAWVQARQHAWEAGSSWVGQGLIEWLAGDSPEAVELRKKATIYFVPIMDVDNVLTGAGGKEAVPHDQNRDWSAMPHFPEVAAAQQRLRELDAAGGLRLYLDIHNPGAADKQPFFYGYFKEQLDTPLRVENHARWLAHATAFMTGPPTLEAKFRVAEYQKKDGNHQMASRTWVWTNTSDRVLATTLEASWDTPHGTIKGYQNLGTQLAKTVAAFLTSAR